MFQVCSVANPLNVECLHKLTQKKKLNIQVKTVKNDYYTNPTYFGEKKKSYLGDLQEG